jgi:hypothetical protein
MGLNYIKLNEMVFISGKSLKIERFCRGVGILSSYSGSSGFKYRLAEFQLGLLLNCHTNLYKKKDFFSYFVYK